MTFHPLLICEEVALPSLSFHSISPLRAMRYLVGGGGGGGVGELMKEVAFMLWLCFCFEQVLLCS